MRNDVNPVPIAKGIPIVTRREGPLFHTKSTTALETPGTAHTAIISPMAKVRNAWKVVINPRQVALSVVGAFMLSTENYIIQNNLTAISK